MRQSLFHVGSFARLYHEPFSSVDRWFALLRILVIAGGFAWLEMATIARPQRDYLLWNFVFFLLYSAALYVFILHFPRHLRTLYLVALLLDLIFLYWLVRYSGGLQSDFMLAFSLLIALHSFYFGLPLGLAVVLASSCVYLLAGKFDFAALPASQLGLRLAFFLLIAVSMAMLSRKEQSDRVRIEKLNTELERRRFELQTEKEKLTKIIGGIDAGLCLVDRGTHLVWVNNVVESWFGAFEQLRGRICARALWGNDGLCHQCPTVKSFQDGTVAQAELERTTSSGQRKFYRLTSAPIRNEQGEVVNVLELIQDITEEKALQAQLAQSAKLAAIGELASGIAHEINNPLSSIAVCVEDLSEMLCNGGLDAAPGAREMQECIQSIKNDINRCKRITTGLLNFSRHKAPQFEPVDVNQVVRNAALFIRHRAEQLHLQIKSELSPDLPLVRAEADELAQVFLNILINAMDFSPAGKAIEVFTERHGPGEIAIRIVDYGAGIPWVNLPKIFSPFFTTKPPGQGTGLGLAISQRIIKRHGGRIEVHSIVGKGTTVTVILPVAEEWRLPAAQKV
ncbi:MAG: ATP-binding protein [candidate division KSB1 bacterium]|nr:ATP-binding protein [candidate division KSB1 bacterium]MDZ7276594.1 ATP-binding protein [candidate division KSB1 bacterium]MDZ7288233.1 ATP-binding protein [candidate division KSB1 bacterium]MDZ7300376.1 ATP-binding protein [candidate division KSB1 bacterium]MDZ7307806.1 ATP-binding protein [candidate division KSB1 bacterium]